MSITSSINNKLNVAFRLLGVSANWIKRKSNEKDDYGSPIIVEEDPVSIQVIPYSTTFDSLLQADVGDTNNAEMNIHYLPDTASITKNDKIEYNNQNYKVIETEELSFGEVILMRAGLAVEH